MPVGGGGIGPCSRGTVVSAATDPAAGGCLDEAAALVDALPDGMLSQFVPATVWLGWGEVNNDQLERAARHFERGLRLARSTGQTYMVAYLNSALGAVRALTGSAPAATRCFEDSLDAAALTGSDEMRAAALTVGCMLAVRRGDLADAVRMGAEAVDAVGHRDRWLASVATPQLANALVSTGDPHAAIELLTRAGGGPELPAVDRVMRVNWYLVLTEAAVLAGLPAEAVAWADQAEAAAAAVDRASRTGLALLARATATLSTDPVAAAALALAAAEHLERTGIVVDRGRALMLAGAALGVLGESDRARACFATARTLFQDAEAHLFLRQLIREERRMMARRRPPGPLAGAFAERYGLTRREVDTVALLAEGLTNREIGQRLHISPKTVEVNLSRIYARLGISGRAALAGIWAGQCAGSGTEG